MQTVIVRYEGALAQSVEREIPGATTVELFNEYGVVTIPDGQLETLRALPEVEYIELPKRLYFDLERGRSVSCLSSATLPGQNVEKVCWSVLLIQELIIAIRILFVTMERAGLHFAGINPGSRKGAPRKDFRSE